MLESYLGVSAMKRWHTGEPFVDDNPQSILITSLRRLPLNLFGSHVDHGTSRIGGTLGKLAMRPCAWGDHGNPKITEQDLVVAPQQHVLGFNIPMNQLLVMRVLKGAGH